VSRVLRQHWSGISRMDVDDGDEYDRILEDGEEYSEEFWVGLRELEQQYVQLYLIKFGIFF